MKLQLYLNDWLFNEMHLPDVLNRIDGTELNWQEEIEYREQVIAAFKDQFKNIFWRQIEQTPKWEIVLVIGSKINLYGVDYFISKNLLYAS